ncbi:MAG: uncharacterized protein A8A55_2549 [Amphiamblys sp. WSBS2006]|nr:MAG: uncharacterized protein A8A55_2549 [Amphiamblys sp. WSBS2006]
MKILSVSLATIPACVGALSNSFVYIPRDVLPRFQTEQERSIYFLDERKQADKLCSVYFGYAARDKTVPSPVSLLRFVYDETEAKAHYPKARDIAWEVARFIADHAEVDTERKLFFVSFANDVSPVQAVPEDVAEISVLRTKENKIDYLYKKEKEHGNLFDRFLAVEEPKREDKEKITIIKKMPAKTKEAVLLLSFLAEKESQLDLEAAPSMHGEEGNKRGLKLPYGVGLFINKKNSCCLKLFDLAETRIKRLSVSSFDITRIELKNTYIEELILVDESALVFFYDSIEKCEFYVEKVSFGNKLIPKSKKLLRLIERVHGGEETAPRKIKALVLNKNSFFVFLEEARRITKRKIHVEDLAVAQSGKDTGPETETRIVVSKRIGIRENACVLLFIELGPEISHLNIDEIQRQCLSPEIVIPRIKFVLTKNKITVRENLHVLQFFNKNITATDVGFFADKGKKALGSTKITLVSGEMKRIVFGEKGLFVLSIIKNEKIDVRQMEIIDIMGVFEKEEEEAKKKEFVIRERLYMRNTGILFLGFLGNTVFIPVIEIDVNRCIEHWGGFEETVGIHVGTNALVKNINQEIEGAGEIKQKIGEMVSQKETAVKNEFGYQKLVFEEDYKHGEQTETGKSEGKPITEYKELCFKERSKRFLHHYDFSGYLYGNYED